MSVGVEMTSYLQKKLSLLQRFGWRHAQLNDMRVLQSPHVFKFTLNTGLVPLSVDLNLGDVFHCNPVFSDRVDRFCRQMKVAIIAGKKLAYFSQFQTFLPQCLLSPCIHRALTRGKSVCPPSRKLKTNFQELGAAEEAVDTEKD